VDGLQFCRSGFDRLHAAVDIARNGEIPRLAVNLYEAVLLAVACNFRVGREHEQVQSAPAGADLGVGAQFTRNLGGSGA
jgi:hypothetical protein